MFNDLIPVTSYAVPGVSNIKPTPTPSIESTFNLIVKFEHARRAFHQLRTLNPRYLYGNAGFGGDYDNIHINITISKVWDLSRFKLFLRNHNIIFVSVRKITPGYALLT